MSDLKIKAKKIDERIAENYTKIKIGGIAEIIYKDNTIRCRNKFTRYLMSTVLVAICNFGQSGQYLNHPYSNCHHVMSDGVTARIGIDEYTSTNPDMSDLVNKVDTAPDSITRRLIKEPDYTLYIAEFVFTWNAETLPDIYEGAPGDGSIDGRVGEFGVYLRTDDDSWSSGISNPNRVTNVKGSPAHTYIGVNSAVRLASRIASADDSFDAFEFYGSIDPLTFKWRFQVAIV